MAEKSIRFEDGDAYERAMGPWSRLAGETFLDWVAPASGLRWIDVGCGTGAFTELIVQRCAPRETQGVDPNEAQLAVARVRPGARGAAFRQGDALALPFDGGRFDAAVMALVIFFLPDPAKGVGEMARVVRPGGLVAAYGWDLLGGGFPFDPIWQEISAAGVTPMLPPSPEAAQTETLRALWTDAGLASLETREIVVERTFASFEDFWGSSTITGSVRPQLDAMTPDDRARLMERVRARQPADAAGRVTHRARANAIKGRVPG
jgi:ubiquinone/menaquinone biosynthesis C-methylase UbiE